MTPSHTSSLKPAFETEAITLVFPYHRHQLLEDGVDRDEDVTSTVLLEEEDDAVVMVAVVDVLTLSGKVDGE